MRPRKTEHERQTLSAFKLRKIDLFPDFVTAQGYLRLSPRTAGTDGFFAALLDRKK